MVGFLLQRPTIPTLLMFPVLVAMYARLGRKEEQEAFGQFGVDYARYAAHTPVFFPRSPKTRQDLSLSHSGD